jgi:uncharacterized protein
MNHPHGTFCFAELHTSDIERDKRFYGDLLHWTAAAAPKTGSEYAVFQLEGRDVAGLRQTTGPRRWVPYISVASVDDVATRAVRHGAAVLTAPFDFADAARMAVLHDPAGGVVGLWEARERGGAQVIDEPGAMWWVELLTREVHVAKSFYTNVLGWRAVDTLKYGIRYSVFKLGDESVAGVLPIGSDWAAVSPYWQVLFATTDCDAHIRRAKELGGSIVFGPNDVPNAGRAAIVADPWGAIFTLMQPAVAGT